MLGGVNMRPNTLLCLSLGWFLTVSPAPGQNVNTEHPGDIQVQKHPSPEDLRARVAKGQLQKDSKELAELCASIPADMDQLQRGLLPKDVDKKLRRLEKLSKNVREELAP
jgi:hypothetical protein